MKIIAATTNRVVVSDLFSAPNVIVNFITADFRTLSFIMSANQAYWLEYNYDIRVKVCERRSELNEYIKSLKS